MSAIAIGSIVFATSIAQNCDAPDALQGLMLFGLPPLAGLCAAFATSGAVIPSAAGRWIASFIVGSLAAGAAWFLVLVFWVGGCSS